MKDHLDHQTIPLLRAHFFCWNLSMQLSIQFSSRLYQCAQESPYALYHISQKFSSAANSSNIKTSLLMNPSPMCFRVQKISEKLYYSDTNTYHAPVFHFQALNIPQNYKVLPASGKLCDWLMCRVSVPDDASLKNRQLPGKWSQQIDRQGHSTGTGQNRWRWIPDNGQWGSQIGCTWSKSCQVSWCSGNPTGKLWTVCPALLFQVYRIQITHEIRRNDVNGLKMLHYVL